MSDNQNPPSLKDHYEKRAKQVRHDHDTIHAEPVTRKEMDDRMAQRQRPQPAPALTPEGGLPQIINPREHSLNERRIGFIRNRLNRHAGKARDDFDRSR